MGMRGVGQIPPHLAAAAAQNPAMVAVNQQAAVAAAAAAQQAAAQAAAVKQNAPRANYKYAPGVRNPAQVMAMGGPQPAPLIQGQSLLLRLCWQLLHHRNKSRCWESVCSRSFKICILNLQEKLLACYWKSTIPN